MRSKFSLTDPDERPNLDDVKPYYDVLHSITILIGRSKMKIGNLLRLERGDIVELSNSAGESLEVQANDRLIAKGDVTVIEDRFAIRINELHIPETDEEER
jgi:flagellar motor switch protein FliN/FliY